MRIVSWNCNGGFHKKAASILSLEPDLLCVQEITERDARLIDAAFVHWVGAPGSRGMAVFSFTGDPCLVDADPLTDLPWFIPVVWNEIHILCVWASVASNSRRYVRLLHEALDRSAEFLNASPAMVIGDFNSNANFDSKHQFRSHSYLVERLESLGMASTYHHLTGDAHGEESSPTFFLYRHLERPYHFDYMFTTTSLLTVSRFEIGPVAEWILHSDHLPLILDLVK